MDSTAAEPLPKSFEQEGVLYQRLLRHFKTPEAAAAHVRYLRQVGHRAEFREGKRDGRPIVAVYIEAEREH